jgi:hypothetical protein
MHFCDFHVELLGKATQFQSSAFYFHDRELWDISDTFTSNSGIDLGSTAGMFFVGPAGAEKADISHRPMI